MGLGFLRKLSFSIFVLILMLLLTTIPKNTFTNAETFETGDNSTVAGCSTHCTYHDPNLECWNKTLSFFERILLSQVRNYVTIQVNIDQWRRRHTHPYEPGFKTAKEESIARMKSYLAHDDFVSHTTVEHFVGSMIDLAKNHSSKTISWIPHFTCPIPCEYRSVVWRNLFIASFILNICLALAVLPLIRRMSMNDANEALIR